MSTYELLDWKGYLELSYYLYKWEKNKKRKTQTEAHND